MDHVFGSKWLINELSHIGFYISYDEVIKYKQSVIQSETLETLLSQQTALLSSTLSSESWAPSILEQQTG